MQRRLLLIGLLAALAVMIIGVGALAMASPNYRLNWIAQGSAGGGTTSSAHYQANLTVGQVAVGNSDSAHYRTYLGFWQGLWRTVLTYLPAVGREQGY